MEAVDSGTVRGPWPQTCRQGLMEEGHRGRWWMGRRDIRGVSTLASCLHPPPAPPPTIKHRQPNTLNPGHLHPAPKYERGTDHSLKQCWMAIETHSSSNIALQQVFRNWRQVSGFLGIRGATITSWEDQWCYVLVRCPDAFHEIFKGGKEPVKYSKSSSERHFTHKQK